MKKEKNKDLLLLNNSDLNISNYDKELDYDSLEGIISAKRNYNRAQSENDTMGMAKANAYANSIRRQGGGYTGGDDGSAYYLTSGTTAKSRPEYKSPYSDRINALYDKITNREKFSYNVDSDPLYQLYKRVYEQAGSDAYNRALATGASRTGGIPGTNAYSSAAQAKARYNAMLAQKATDMYNDAYDKYISEGKEMRSNLDTLRGMEDDSYSKYRDAVSDYEYDKEADYKRYRDEAQDLADAVKYDVNTAYQKSRDEISDHHWAAEQQYKRESEERALDYQRERDAAEDARWKAQTDTEKYNTLAKLIQSVYNKSNIGVDIDAIKALLGI